jgi:hypothetical protein
VLHAVEHHDNCKSTPWRRFGGHVSSLSAVKCAAIHALHAAVQSSLCTSRINTYGYVYVQFSGHRALNVLSPHCDVLMIDAKGFFEYTPSMLRCLVEPAHARRCVMSQPRQTLTSAATALHVGNGVLLACSWMIDIQLQWLRTVLVCVVLLRRHSALC